MARYATLDALRGTAALAVMIGHSPGHPLTLHGSYLAVDLFFGLSGFVIAHSYHEAMEAGLSPGRFMALRVARLWPMVILGALMGITLGGGWWGMLLLIPEPGGNGYFPANPALWSLLVELQAYLIFALGAWRLPTKWLLGCSLALGICLALTVLVFHFELRAVGGSWDSAIPGLARVGYPFGLGMVMWRLRGSVRTTKIAFLLPVALVALMVPAMPLNGLIQALVLLPVVLWCGTRAEILQPAWAQMLADISYPLYCMHMPFLAAWISLGMPVVGAWPAIVILALLVDRGWDRPMRRWLRQLAERNWRAHPFSKFGTTETRVGT